MSRLRLPEHRHPRPIIICFEHDAQLSESTPTPGCSCGDTGTNLLPSKWHFVLDAVDVEVMKKIQQGKVDVAGTLVPCPTWT